MKFEYIHIMLIERGDKTNKYSIRNNKTEECLGFLKWYAPWKQYCFYPEEGTIWNSSCLDDIGKVVRFLNNAHKSRR